MPGKLACEVRMKKATASWSSTIQPTGSARAIQDRSRSSRITSWKRSPVIVSSAKSHCGTSSSLTAPIGPA